MRHILGHRYIKSLLAGDTGNISQDIDLRVEYVNFCTSSKKSIINKKPRSKTPLNSRTPFTWVLMDIIPALSSIILTKDTTHSNYLLIVCIKNTKTVRNRKYHHWGSHGQSRHVLSQIWKSRWIWLVRFRANRNWSCLADDIQGF